MDREPIVEARSLKLGKGVRLGEGVQIRGLDGPAEIVEIGDQVFIGEYTKIIVPGIKIGDYTKIHNHTLIYGYKPCVIGHNCWFGQGVILDSIGGLIIGNNVGIGAYSQIWSHIKYGDTLAGCRFLSNRTTVIEDDVWFVGHCIVSPITAHEKSMALVGSVVTKDMEPNHIYAGVPANDVSDKIGFQFMETSPEERLTRLKGHLAEFLKIHPEFEGLIEPTIIYPSNMDDNVSYFNVTTRTYTKRGTEAEIKFIEFLLPEKGKFVPLGSERISL